MPLQNRVTPEGRIVAHPGRGLFMGNRGILHDDHRRLVNDRWKVTGWVTCALAFKDRHRTVMSPGTYTELFFLDEAVSLAAGHRPCFHCRNADARRFQGFWCGAMKGPVPSAREMDAILHAARIDPTTRQQRTHQAPLYDLPDGTFVRLAVAPAPLLVWGDRLYPYDPAGYAAPTRRPANAEATVLTPKPTFAVLAAGYRPVIHPSAGGW